MDQSQVIGSRVARVEQWFKDHPDVYDAVRRDELRTLYTTLGFEVKALEQSDIILAHQFNDAKTLLLLSETELATGERSYRTIKSLLSIASRYPQFKYVGAAARLRAGDLLVAQGKTKPALAIYRQVYTGPAQYARLARKKYREVAEA